MKLKYGMVFLMGVFLMMAQPAEVLAARVLKKTVAVFEFENDSGYSHWATIGRDFTEQLSDALVQSGRFIVLTREDIDIVLAEQDLANSNRFTKSATAQVGKAIPAQILIKGKITDFEENTSTGGQGLKIKGFSFGAKKSSASIGIIVQMIDSTTGQIIDSKRVDGESRGGGLSLGYSGAFDISSSNFQKTPVGKAVQMAIDQAVEYLSGRLSNMPWQAKVVTVKEGTVYINAGNNTGISVGETFEVYREGESLIDPDTGINLGSDRTRSGDIKITEVHEKFAKARVIGNVDTEIQKGDLVIK